LFAFAFPGKVIFLFYQKTWVSVEAKTIVLVHTIFSWEPNKFFFPFLWSRDFSVFQKQGRKLPFPFILSQIFRQFPPSYIARNSGDSLVRVNFPPPGKFNASDRVVSLLRVGFLICFESSPLLGFFALSFSQAFVEKKNKITKKKRDSIFFWVITGFCFSNSDEKFSPETLPVPYKELD
jgi:hypothetical protein